MQQIKLGQKARKHKDKIIFLAKEKTYPFWESHCYKIIIDTPIIIFCTFLDIPIGYIKEVNKVFYKFLWNSHDRIKRISPDESRGNTGFISVPLLPKYILCMITQTLSKISIKLGTHMYLGQERKPILRSPLTPNNKEFMAT